MNIVYASPCNKVPSKSNSTRRGVSTSPGASGCSVALMPRSRSRSFHTAEQACKFPARIGRAHERLADQECMHARAAQPGHVLARADARFGPQDALVGHPLAQFERRLASGFEGTQVAVVDAH